MKVTVFIDNSNVFKNIQTIRNNGDKDWVSFYDPLKLAEKLTGNRELVEVNFYCTRPPAYLLGEDDWHREIYKRTNRYYAAIEKLHGVNVKYGTLTGPKGEVSEKNLGTQITTDLVTGAAFSKFDTAIIVSNDGDYVSAIEGIEVFGKKIEVVFFRGSFSMNLRRVSDVTRRMRKSFLQPLDFNRK